MSPRAKVGIRLAAYGALFLAPEALGGEAGRMSLRTIGVDLALVSLFSLIAGYLVALGTPGEESREAVTLAGLFLAYRMLRIAFSNELAVEGFVRTQMLISVAAVFAVSLGCRVRIHWARKKNVGETKADPVQWRSGFPESGPSRTG